MRNKKDWLAYRKKMRTYLKHLVTASSIILLAGYIATSVFGISSISVYLAIAGVTISAISLALNVWSLIDHFQKHDANKQIGIENRLLSNLTCERQVLGAQEENRTVLNIHEDLSTEATTQFPTEVECRKKSNTSKQKKKLTRICLDIASSVSFLVGGAIPLILSTASYDVSIISFVSTSFFIVGCAVMAVNVALWCTDSKLQKEENNNVQIEQHSFSGVEKGA
ncbi:hypothetical protein [Wolbachia endosymbiont of Folsomia candida]|uniref:hypothetical protein n=1 Tax=Wolbachia endosymbiont of Folsomia candida TaxID=169402 RepID=UPI000A44531A|nr:hypothetical protein [Wolbachia endosymbiont of Folsomia candida]APR98145.1 hypothetical protein ASM33_02425 [Wolbachia endosymbiont of Folsomia candida]